MPSPNTSRRRFCAGLPALAAALAGCTAVPNVDTGAEVPPFSRAVPDGALPSGWEPYTLRRDLPPTDYRVVELHGRPALEASGAGVASALQCRLDVDPLVRPWLRWHWQVDQLDPGMTVADRNADDSPARVVVAFDGDISSLPLRERAFFDAVELITGQRLPYATIMYVWDAQLAVGQTASYFRTSRVQYLVAESGTARTGRWLPCERNVAEDYRRLFGAEPGRIRSVGVLTDSDDLQVDVKAWYGDISLSRT